MFRLVRELHPGQFCIVVPEHNAVTAGAVARERAGRTRRPRSVGRSELRIGATLLEERDRPTVGSGNAPPLGINSEVPVEGGEEVPDPHPPVRRVLAAPVDVTAARCASTQESQLRSAAMHFN